MREFVRYKKVRGTGKKKKNVKDKGSGFRVNTEIGLR